MKENDTDEAKEPILEAEALYEEPNCEDAPTPSPQYTINMIGEHSKVISNCETVNIYD